MADVEYVPKRYNSNTWAWVLLLPIFFLLGWFANSYVGNSTNQNRPQVGVGGGPGTNPEGAATPSPTPTMSPVPTGVPTLILPTATITP